MYVDEVGNDDLTNVHDEKHRYLSLTGVIFELDYMRDVFVPALESFKRTFFRSDPDERIIFHRKDILKRKGPFGTLREVSKGKLFDNELQNLIRDHNYKVITAVIDKKAL